MICESLLLCDLCCAVGYFVLRIGLECGLDVMMCLACLFLVTLLFDWLFVYVLTSYTELQYLLILLC